MFASALSLAALLLAMFKLPESLKPDSASAARSWFGFGSVREALATPSVGLLILASFICVLAFGNLEATASLLLKGETESGRTIPTPFKFSYYGVIWTFVFIGFVLALVQGGLVRRLSGRISEGKMGAAGAVLQIGGFGLLIYAIDRQSQTGDGVGILFGALALATSGFAFMTPSINSLISRKVAELDATDQRFGSICIARFTDRERDRDEEDFLSASRFAISVFTGHSHRTREEPFEMPWKFRHRGQGVVMKPSNLPNDTQTVIAQDAWGDYRMTDTQAKMLGGYTTIRGAELMWTIDEIKEVTRQYPESAVTFVSVEPTTEYSSILP